MRNRFGASLERLYETDVSYKLLVVKKDNLNLTFSVFGALARGIDVGTGEVVPGETTPLPGGDSSTVICHPKITKYYSLKGKVHMIGSHS